MTIYLFKHSRPLANLHISDIVAVDGKANCGADFVESVLPCCSRVDVQKLVDWVEHHLQNVGVSRNEYVGLGTLNHSYSRR